MVVSDALGHSIDGNPKNINSLVERGSKFGKLISWSKHGIIAFASPPDLLTQQLPNQFKHNLLLTYLERVDENSWQLAKSEGLSAKPLNDHTASPSLSLVCWSNLSTDLAVSDVHGNFYIYLAGVGVINNKQLNGTSNGTSSNGGLSSNGSNGTNGGTNSTTSSSADKPTDSSNGISAGSNASISYELTSYNHLEMIYRDIVDPSTSLTTGASLTPSINSIVGFKWLNIEKNQMLNKPATINVPPLLNSPQQSPPNASITYSYGVNQFAPLGATHPIPTKQACVALRGNGEFHLYYQGEHKVEYHKVTHKLSSSVNNPVNFKTASIGFSKRKEIIVTGYDTLSQMIKTFAITIDWGFLIQSAQKQKTDPHFQTPKELQSAPKLQVKFLYEMSPMGIEVEIDQEKRDDDEMDIDSHEGSKDSDGKKSVSEHIGNLSCIEIISPNFFPDSELEILIAYDSYSSINDFVPNSTTIYRYTIVDQLSRISDAFSELGLQGGVGGGGVGRDNSGNAKSYALELQDKMNVDGIIQSISTTIVDTFIILSLENGQLQLIDRNTMSIVDKKKQAQQLSPTKSPPSSITTLFDIGFEFPKLPTGAHNMICVSPNLTSLVYIPINSPHQELTFKVFESNRKIISSIDLFITSVGFAFRHAYTCYTNTCSDDLLALIQIEIKEIRYILKKTLKDGSDRQVDNVLNKLVESVICESHKAISFQLDVYGKESVDKLLSNPPLQKLLSLQLILGEFGQYHHTKGNLNAKVSPHRVVKDLAWIVLNLRCTSFGIMFLLSSIFRQINKKKPTEDTLQDSISRAEYITSLLGSIKWLIDLSIYINQELIYLSNESLSGEQADPNNLNFNNSIALPILLSKIPRLFLMYAFSSLGKTNEVLVDLYRVLTESKKLYPPMRDALNRYLAIYSNAALNIRQFETFIRECDTYINMEIERETKGRGKNFSLKIEQKLVCQGVVSEEIQKIAKAILNKYSAMSKRDPKTSDIFFYDVDWLSIGIKPQGMNQVGQVAAETDEANCTIIYNYPNQKLCITPRLHYKDGEYVDGLRKIIIDAGAQHKISKSVSSLKLRKCTRCRSISYVNDPLVFASPTTIGLWTMVFQRTCLCGSAWINCIDK